MKRSATWLVALMVLCSVMLFTLCGCKDDVEIAGNTPDVSMGEENPGENPTNQPDADADGTGESPATQAPAAKPLKEERYMARKLTDEQLNELKNADVYTLQEEISTLMDAVAWLDQFEYPLYDGLSDDFVIEINSALDGHRGGNTAPSVYTMFVGWCLADDYPEAKYLIASGNEPGMGLWSYHGLLLPTGGGYRTVSPAKYSKQFNTVRGLDEITGSSVDDIAKRITLVHTGMSDDSGLVVHHLLAADVGVDRFELKFDGIFFKLTDDVEELYREGITNEEHELKEGWGNLQVRWVDFEFPACFEPTLTKSKVEALIGKDIDTVAQSLKTFGDVFYYLALSGYYTTNGDLKVREDELYWSFNETPRTVFANNAGNCGGTAAFVAFLLDDDYTETGCLSMTLDVAFGEGHVITYIQDGDTCYVFDPREIVDTRYMSNGGLSRGSNVVEAGQKWQSTVGPDYKLIFAYPTNEGDLPSITDGKIRYLPEQYRDRIKIVYEATSEGYQFRWRSIGKAALEQIEGVRNPMTDRPGSDVKIDRTGNYLTHVLTDKQLKELKYADAATLQAWISTVADAVAWLDQFESPYPMYDGLTDDFVIEIENAVEGHRIGSTAPSVYTMFAGWCLADDYPEAKYLIASGKEPGGTLWGYHTLLLPTAGGYRTISPAKYSTQTNNVYGFDEIMGSSMADIAKRATLVHLGMTDDSALIVYHLVAVDVGAGQVDLDFEDHLFRLTDGVEELYRVEVSEQQKIEDRFLSVQRHWTSYNYGQPASFKPSLTRAQVEALLEKDMDTVAAALKTWGDVMSYLALAGYHTTNGDINIDDQGFNWDVNDAPATVFANKGGNCGGIAAFVAFLLDGDYTETGCLSMSYDVAITGGHVITYIQDGNTCYVFDSRGILDSDYSWNGGFTAGKNVVDAGRKWQSTIAPEAKLLCAYQTSEGDLPGSYAGKISYLPEQFRDRITIVYEATSEGYQYVWRPMGQEAMEKFEAIRNVSG